MVFDEPCRTGLFAEPQGTRCGTRTSAGSHRSAAPREDLDSARPPRLRSGHETALASGRRRALRGASRLGVAYASRYTHLLRTRDARHLRVSATLRGLLRTA